MDADGDSGAKQYTLGYNYNITKLTKVYAFYTAVDNDRRRQLRARWLDHDGHRGQGRQLLVDRHRRAPQLLAVPQYSPFLLGHNLHRGGGSVF